MAVEEEENIKKDYLSRGGRKGLVEEEEKD